MTRLLPWRIPPARNSRFQPVASSRECFDDGEIDRHACGVVGDLSLPIAVRVRAPLPRCGWGFAERLTVIAARGSGVLIGDQLM